MGYALPSGVVGFMVTPHWREVGCFGLLPMAGVGGLLGYSSLGERVGYLLSAGELGFKVTSQSGMGGSVVIPQQGGGFVRTTGEMGGHWLPPRCGNVFCS